MSTIRIEAFVSVPPCSGGVMLKRLLKQIETDFGDRVEVVLPVPADQDPATWEPGAEEIAANSPLAVQGSKAVLNASRQSRVREDLDRVALWNAAFLYSDDLSEAIQAFLEKRPPDYKGQ